MSVAQKKNQSSPQAAAKDAAGAKAKPAAGFFRNRSLAGQVGIGYALLALVLVVTVSITIWKTQQVGTVTNRLIDLRAPTTQASLSLLNGMNHSLAALRGWMILGNEKFKTERARAWSDEIEPALATLQEYATNWTNPKNVERLRIIEKNLKDFKTFQQEIESISNTVDNTPALKILLEDAAPQASILVTKITEMIDEEGTLPATPERKALLAMMADVRGTTGLALANIRTYLLSGDEKFRDAFDKIWSENKKRVGELTANATLLNDGQAGAFATFKEARAIFGPLPPKMFEIRGGTEWNRANAWLGTKATPTAFAIKTELDQMIASQQQLMATDSTAAKAMTSSLRTTAWVLLFVGLGVAGGMGFFLTRSVAGQVNRMVEAERESAKLASVVTNASNSIMVTDNDFNITYMNPASFRNFKAVEKLLPIPIDQIVGSNIDVFHKDPGYVRSILNDPRRLPHKAEILLGGEVYLSLDINALSNDKGEPLGAYGRVGRHYATQESREQSAARE